MLGSPSVPYEKSDKIEVVNNSYCLRKMKSLGIEQIGRTSSFTTEKSFDNSKKVSFAHAFGNEEENLQLRKKQKSTSFN